MWICFRPVCVTATFCDLPLVRDLQLRLGQHHATRKRLSLGVDAERRYRRQAPHVYITSVHAVSPSFFCSVWRCELPFFHDAYVTTAGFLLSSPDHGHGPAHKYQEAKQGSSALIDTEADHWNSSSGGPHMTVQPFPEA